MPTTAGDRVFIDADGGRDVLERINAQPQEESDQSRSCAGLLNELISRAFGGMHAPHQKLVFGFVRLLEWKPSEIVKELTDVPLGSLLERMANDLVEQGGLPAGIVEDALNELHSIMQQGLKFVEVVKDPKTAATYPRMACRVVRDTTLREYYKTPAVSGREVDFGLRQLIARRRPPTH